jgi:cyclohexanone monooxygenase
MGLTQTGLAPNCTYLLEGQARHIARLISEVNAGKATSIEPTPEAERVALMTKLKALTEYQNACTPGYYNGEGQNTGIGFVGTQYPQGAPSFFKMLARRRKQGDFKGLIMK